MEGNILANKSANDRSSTDFYPTPPEVTKALMTFLNLPKYYTIWEPACGEGHMSKSIEGMGYQVISTELNETSYGETGIDFLNCESRECDWIITNPPFKESINFINRCIELGKPFALLLKSQYWHAKNKTNLFNQFKPRYVLPLNWRPDFHFGKKGGSPTMECIWVVWYNEPSEITEYEILAKPI
jgi:hypothetical protein